MEEGPRRRVRIHLRGIVQGVGFRPFVYNLARELGLGGYVLNSSAGLTAEAEGAGGAVDAFARRIVEDAPPLAWIQESEIGETAVRRRVRVRDPRQRGGDGRVRAHLAGCRDVRRLPARFHGPRQPPLRVRRSRIAPTAGRATPSSATFPTTGRTPPWPDSNCARIACASTTIRPTAGFTRSRTPARFAVRRSRRRSARRGGGWRRGRFWPSKGWADSTWPAMPATRRPWSSSAQRKRRSDKPFALMAARPGGGRGAVRGDGARPRGSRESAAPHRRPAREGAGCPAWRRTTARWG